MGAKLQDRLASIRFSKIKLQNNTGTKFIIAMSSSTMTPSGKRKHPSSPASGALSTLASWMGFSTAKKARRQTEEEESSPPLKSPAPRLNLPPAAPWMSPPVVTAVDKPQSPPIEKATQLVPASRYAPPVKRAVLLPVSQPRRRNIRHATYRPNSRLLVGSASSRAKRRRTKPSMSTKIAQQILNSSSLLFEQASTARDATTTTAVSVEPERRTATRIWGTHQTGSRLLPAVERPAQIEPPAPPQPSIQERKQTAVTFVAPVKQAPPMKRKIVPTPAKPMVSFPAAPPAATPTPPANKDESEFSFTPVRPESPDILQLVEQDEGMSKRVRFSIADEGRSWDKKKPTLKQPTPHPKKKKTLDSIQPSSTSSASAFAFMSQKPAVTPKPDKSSLMKLDQQQAAKEQESKPTIAQEGKAEAPGAKQITSSWGAAMYGNKDNWKCSVCMTSNKQAAQQCMACEADRPGSSSTTAESSGDTAPAPASTPKFQFGSIPSAAKSDEATPSTTAPPVSGGFVFGGKPAAEMTTGSSSTSSNPTGPGLSFGQATTTTETTSKSGGFSFGQAAEEKTQEEKKSSDDATTNGTTPGISFGSTPAPPALTKEDTETKPSKSFSFGNTTAPSAKEESYSTPKTFAFGSTPAPPADSKPIGAATTSFGAAPTSASTSSDSFGGAPAFSFGSGSGPTPAPATAQSASFSFGATSSSTTATPAFGGSTDNKNDESSKKKQRNGEDAASSSASTAAPSFGSATPAPPASGTPAFTFGSATPAPVAAPASTPGFSFGSSAPSSSAGFGATPAAPAPAAPPSSGPAFSFGSATPAPAAEPPKTGGPAFSFGNTSAAAPTFGNGNSATPAPAFGNNGTPAPSFGNTTTPAPAFGNSATPAPAFGNSATPAPAFAFGSAPVAAPTPTPSASAGFGFSGAGAATPQLPPSQFGAAPPAQGGFGFGAGGAAATPQPAPSQFGAGGFGGGMTPTPGGQQTPAGGGFSIGAGGSTKTPGRSGRRIIRAKRPPPSGGR
eukprot:scaffold5099_cov50-Attheya_sp.AAC.8